MRKTTIELVKVPN